MAAGIIRQNLAEVGVDGHGEGAAVRRVGRRPASAGASTWGSGSASGGRRRTSSTGARWTRRSCGRSARRPLANFHRFASEEASRPAPSFRGELRPAERAEGGPSATAEDLRRERAQPAALREPALGRVQQRAASPASPAASSPTPRPRRSGRRTCCRRSSTWRHASTDGSEPGERLPTALAGNRSPRRDTSRGERRRRKGKPSMTVRLRGHEESGWSPSKRDANMRRAAGASRHGRPSFANPVSSATTSCRACTGSMAP